MLKYLLSFHERSEEKLNDLDYFTYGEHTEWKGSTCFFAVKTNGERIDFSLNKILNG